MNLKKVSYAVLGWCAVALAFVGAVTPGLPSTEFVLAAAFCFARSSPRFERWLLENRWFGPRLRRMRETGGMTEATKAAAITLMWLWIGLSAVALLFVSLLWSSVLVALGTIGTLTILYGIRTAPARN